MNHKQLLAAIERSTARVEARRAAVREQTDKRTALFHLGRSLDPPVTFKAMATAAKITDVAVHDAMGRG